MKAVVNALVEHFSTEIAESKKALLDQVLSTWQKHVGDTPDSVLWVPGRIEVLGKHTDYCGGRSLLAAASRGFVFAVRAREDIVLRTIDATSGDVLASQLHPDVAPRLGHWSNYPETVFRRLARNFAGPLRGADIVFASDLPPAAGMSSSSALMVGCFLVLNLVNDFESHPDYIQNIQTPEDLAGYLGTLENGQTFGTLVGDKGVGTFGGSEDHTAIMNCLAGHLSQYAYCPVQFERHLDLPDDYMFAIGVSGVVAEKTGAALEKYNQASGLAFEALKVWNKMTGRRDAYLADALKAQGAHRILEVLEASQSDKFDTLNLIRRFKHFVVENEEILPKAGDALAKGDVVEFGKWVNASQEQGVTLLQNQIPETELLARLAGDLGAVGASAFGAGFGGSVWALVHKGELETFLSLWQERYLKIYPQHAHLSQFFGVEPSPGAFRLA